jgi:hypothetical protein
MRRKSNEQAGRRKGLPELGKRVSPDSDVPQDIILEKGPFAPKTVQMVAT